MELGVAYPIITRRLAEVHARLSVQGSCQEYWVDATGVGKG